MKPLLVRCSVSSLAMRTSIFGFEKEVATPVAETSRVDLKFLGSRLIHFQIIRQIGIIFYINSNVLALFWREQVTMRLLRCLLVIESS